MLQPGVELIQAEVQEIDPERQQVRAGDREIAYDYLVVALGAHLAPEVMPGFSEAAHTPYDLEGATALQSALPGFRGGRVAVLISALPYKCPAAPYEIALLLDDYCRRRGMRDNVEIQVYTPEPMPMGVAGPVVSQAVVAMLEEREIAFNPQLTATRIDPAVNKIIFEGREPAAFDLLVGVPPHVAPRAVRESPLANQSGWVPVDRRTLRAGYDNVFAIGDVSAVTLANGKPLPKAGVFAHFEAEAVARAIAADVQGRAERHEFDGTGYCWLETGSGVAAFAAGNFYAEPDPVVKLQQPRRIWHLGKVLFEKYWMGSGAIRAISRLGLNTGSKFLGIPGSI